MEKKSIQFDHFRPYFLAENESGETIEKPYNLGKLLRLIQKTSPAATVRRIYGDMYLFYICNYDEKLKIWELQILHLREKILPGIADVKGEYELIELAAGKFPAESTTILFDEMRCTLYMQRNIYGTSIKCMEEYLEALSPEHTSVLLKPIIKGNKINRIVPSNLYRSVVLVADTENIDESVAKKSLLIQTLNAFNKYEGRIVKIEMGFGHTKSGFLKSDSTSELVKQAYDYKGTQKLIVRTSNPTDVCFETIDLLDDREKFIIKLEYSRETPITHGRIYYECLRKYKDNLGIGQ